MKHNNNPIRRLPGAQNPKTETLSLDKNLGGKGKEGKGKGVKGKERKGIIDKSPLFV